jgi:hypothetical protein
MNEALVGRDRRQRDEVTKRWSGLRSFSGRLDWDIALRPDSIFTTVMVAWRLSAFGVRRQTSANQSNREVRVPGTLFMLAAAAPQGMRSNDHSQHAGKDAVVHR